MVLELMQDITKVFLPFFSQKKRFRYRTISGKKIIDDHNGSIVIESENEASVKITFADLIYYAKKFLLLMTITI